jgi:hypothetical protein
MFGLNRSNVAVIVRVAAVPIALVTWVAVVALAVAERRDGRSMPDVAEGEAATCLPMN